MTSSSVFSLVYPLSAQLLLMCRSPCKSQPLPRKYDSSPSAELLEGLLVVLGPQACRGAEAGAGDDAGGGPDGGCAEEGRGGGASGGDTEEGHFEWW